MTIHIALDSGMAAQTGATDGAWVSGAVASAAISATADVIFDLGSRWRMLRTAVVSGSGLADSTGGTMTADFASNAAFTQGVIPAISPNSLSGKVSYTGVLSQAAYHVMITDRYLRVRLVNGSSAAQPATAAVRVCGHDL